MELHAGTWGLRMHPATSQLSPRARIIIYTLYINYTSNTNDKKKKSQLYIQQYNSQRSCDQQNVM